MIYVNWFQRSDGHVDDGVIYHVKNRDSHLNFGFLLWNPCQWPGVYDRQSRVVGRDGLYRRCDPCNPSLLVSSLQTRRRISSVNIPWGSIYLLRRSTPTEETGSDRICYSRSARVLWIWRVSHPSVAENSIEENPLDVYLVGQLQWSWKTYLACPRRPDGVQ